jgi:dTMP kinase
MERGFLVTFEGIEGCGKTTQLKLASRWLQELRFNVCATREPGGTEIGNQIRKILLSESNSGIAPLSEALLYMADRFQHIEQVIRPALTSGQIVLCDRYHDSTIAYQGYARQIPLDLLNSIWKTCGDALEPDLTLLFDLEPSIGLERSFRKLAAQQIDESRFEKEALGFHARVRDGFLQLAKQNPHRIHIIDASSSIDAVHAEVVRILQDYLKKHHEIR